MYVEQLAGEQTVNTMPPELLRRPSRITGRSSARRSLKASTTPETYSRQLRVAGIDYDDITEVLEDEGVKKFADSFRELFDGVEAKRDAMAVKSS